MEIDEENNTETFPRMRIGVRIKGIAILKEPENTKRIIQMYNDFEVPESSIGITEDELETKIKKILTIKGYKWESIDGVLTSVFDLYNNDEVSLLMFCSIKNGVFLAITGDDIRNVASFICGCDIEHFNLCK